MKQLMISIIVLTAIIFIACNGNDSKKEKDGIPTVSSDTTKPATTTDNKDVKEITPTFASVDASIAGNLKSIVDHYLHIKNALANDNSEEASNGSKMLSQSLSKVDKSFFSADQKKVYDDIEDDLKEHAEHIGKTSVIKHQREHFSMMSEDVYDLVKAFGAGKVVYHDHCPMANDGKGAMWISELAEIKNPYMGSNMPTCGSVEEKIK